MRLARWVVAVVLLAGLVAGADAAEPRALRVLFVGNSLTATNDLPFQVAALADATGRKLEHRTIASRLFQAAAARALGRRLPATAALRGLGLGDDRASPD